MQNQFLEEVVVSIVGKSAEPIAGLLNTKKHVNEFIIAKKLDITINQTRNILYKLSDHGLVSSIRKKDKKKGWYTYFWRIENLKSLEFLKELLVKKINQFEQQINSRETKKFYICEKCNIEFNEENALLCDFTCNECGEIFTLKDNTGVLRGLKKNLEKFKSELEIIEVEIGKEKGVVEKVKVKQIKKEEKEKQAKKAETALKRKTLRDIKNKSKEKLKVSKKVVKKKITKKVKNKK
jgi:transcription factor E